MNVTKTGVRCSVKFCKSKANARNVSFFKYPNDKRLMTWINNCKTEELTEALHKKNNYKICGEHFEDKMFLNVTTKNRLVFNAIPTKFNDEILFKRKKAEKQCKIHLEPTYDDGLKNQNGCNRSTDVFDISNKSCSTAAIDFSSQTPGYFSSNTSKKQKLVMEIKPGKKRIKNLKKTIISLRQQLSQYDTEENFLKLSQKYLSPSLFSIVNYEINLKKNNR